MSRPLHIFNLTIKYFLFFLLMFILFSPIVARAATIGVRVEPNQDHNNCPCSNEYKPPPGQTKKVNETIRLFIPIPGVTDGCGYLCDINGDYKGDVVDYVVAIYKFLVGLAAIMAVIMIMVGGYQWIFAMGSSSAIESAKDTIKSALFGLLLTLFSYQVLHFINPRLTDVVLPDVEEIGRMQIGGYLCGGDDVLVDDVGFNTRLVGSFAEAIKDGKKLADTDFYLQSTRQGSGYGYSSTPFTIDRKKLILGLHPASATATEDILKCDNEAKSYLIPATKGGTTYRNPSGPEVKIAHFNTTKEAKDANNKEITKVVGIDCFYGLCDTSSKSLVDSGVALANAITLKDYASGYYKDKKDYIFDEDDVEIYNSVSTRVEPRGGGCYGSFCDPQGKGLTLCLSRSGMEIGCWNISQMCKDTDKSMCEEMDQTLQASFTSTMQTGGIGELPVACSRRIDQNWNPDQCVLGLKFDCPIGYPQIDPLTSSAKETETNPDACWREDKKTKEKKKLDCWKSSATSAENHKVLPVDSGFAVDQISAVCCEERQNVPGEDYGKFRGICVESFDAAYSTQTFNILKKICDDREDQNDSSCHMLTTHKYITQWDGDCELQTGFINGELQDAFVCMPLRDNEKKPTAKVCHLGKKDHIMYESVEACATRYIKGKWTGSMNPLQWYIMPFLKKNKNIVIDCESYILPYDYPCLDLPAAGEFGDKKSGGTGDTGDITGKVDNVVAYLKAHPEVKQAISTEAQKLQSLPDWPFQSFPVGLVGSAPIVPMSVALASNGIDADKFVVVLMAREIGGYKLDDPQNPPEKFCSPNPNGTVDCGLMQVNSQRTGNCPQTCEELSLFDINENIRTGVVELVNYFNNPLCGIDTSCQQTVNDVDGLKRYRWVYMITKYNGGNNANAVSNSCQVCPSDAPADRCNKIPDDQQGCFIGKVDAVPTQVECPYDDSCGIEGGTYRTITYPYVLDMIKGYQHLTK